MANLGYIQLNRTCDQQCLMCSNPENGNVLTFKKAKYYIDDFIKNDMAGVIFTGGEPTLNKNLSKLIKYCKDNNLEVRIITNGQKTSDYEYLMNLKNNGLNLMHVSIQSIKPDVQDYISQKKGSLKNIFNTLINARRLGIKVNINTVINSLNAKSLDKNVRFINNKFPEIHHFVFNNLDPKMNRVEKNKFLVPKLSDFEKALYDSLNLLTSSNKSFRVERVPLCFMKDFEQFATETRKIVKDEERRILFLDDREDSYSKQNYFFYKKPSKCEKCSLNKICAGLYAMDEYYDSKELIPQKKSVQLIKNKIIKYV